jgi:hypothetical protein
LFPNKLSRENIAFCCESIKAFLDKSMKARKYLNVLFAMSVLLVGMTPVIGRGETIYVDSDASPGGDGLSWGTAYRYLQDALHKPPTSGDEIWVAAGIYKPDKGSGETVDDRRAAFQLINGVAIYGGFAGGESSLDERDWETNETILSGDVCREGIKKDNSYHVVNGSGTGATAVLDGFTITAGNAHGYGIERFGGGMYNGAGSPTVTNCTFTGNSADIGGGIHNYCSSPTVTNCAFTGNSAEIGGGGMSNGAGSPTVTNCTFTGNSAEIGGGMFNYYHGNPTLTNCTFSGNSVSYYGGGMYNSYSCPTMSNCILWGNSGRQIYNEWMSSPAVNYCCVQDWSGGGTGNISGKPLFVREPNDGGDGWGIGDNDDFGDLHLTHSSPCIDAGDNNSLPVDAGDLDGDGNITEPIPWDLDGQSRCVDDPATADTGNGVPPIVDMGAYEYQRTRPLIYVDADATGANDGTSWADAFKYLQDALYKPLTSGDEIWVASGTYKPDVNSANPSGTGEREATFQLISGVAIYGGFAGGESSLGERDWTSNVTILSGDLDDNDIDVNDLSNLWDEPTRAENSYHIVMGSGTDATAVLDGFSITAGNAVGSDPYYYGGGMYNYSGSPTVTNCTFSTNSAEYEGGGMYNENSNPTVTNCTFSFNAVGDCGGGMENYDNSRPTVSDCNFIDNLADYYGGGMHNYSGNPTVTNCTFSFNAAGDYGGGMYNMKSSPTVTNCTFSFNAAGDYGGGMYNYSASPTVTNCTFSTNSVESEGGGMYNEDSSPTVTNCTFSFNAAGDYGGGMENYDNSHPTVSDCNFIGNWADDFGGGMENWDDSNATVINCKFINNYTYDFGGGMDNDYCNPTVINCTFIGNEGDYGGGMYNYDGSPTVTNCTFSGNEGDYGGMYNEYSSLTVTNCTFSGNSGYYGGGMYNYESDATVINCTFSGNSADNEGGGMYNEDSSPTVTNCIIWANGGSQIYHTGSGSTTVSYSDVQGGWSGTGNINADPLFIGPNGLDGIGGTADDNLRLSAGSPCIDVGDNNSVPADTDDLDGDGNTVEPIPWDLDGRDRFIDGDCNDTEIVDMGAYEFSWICLGDFDGECDVDFADFAIMTYYRGGDESLVDIAPLPNGDGIVDKRDLGVLCDNWLLGVE